MLKTFVFSLAIITMSGSVYAQDKIYKSDGDVLATKIKSVGIRTITYLLYNNLSGPEYTIAKIEVDKIVYENGSTDFFDDMRPRLARRARHATVKEGDVPQSPKLNYKPDVLAIAPLQFSENGLGVGLSYERALDKDGFLSFYMPVVVTFDLNNGTYVDASGNTQNGNPDIMFYAMPGIKLYPTGSYGPVKYSIGPSLVVGSGQKSSVTTSYDPTTGNTVTTAYVTQSHFLLGMIINNSLNINPSPHIYLGLEVGLGFTYMNQVGGINQGTEFLAQGGFKIGFRF